MARVNVIERGFSRLLRKPPTVRAAASTIVVATAAIVGLSGLLIHLLDRSEFPNIWISFWWAIQTVTTVGYGDVVPKNVSGRIVASFVMLEGIAIVAITTAAITSTFVTRARTEIKAFTGEDTALSNRLDELDRKLDLIQTTLAKTPEA